MPSDTHAGVQGLQSSQPRLNLVVELYLEQPIYLHFQNHQLQLCVCCLFPHFEMVYVAVQVQKNSTNHTRPPLSAIDTAAEYTQYAAHFVVENKLKQTIKPK